MTVVVHYEDGMRKDNYAHKWIYFLKSHDIKVLALDFRSCGAIDKIRQIRPGGAMWHYYHAPRDLNFAPQFLMALEINYNIVVWPNIRTRWHFDDKVSQYLMLKALDIPIIDTHVFFRKDEALSWLKQASYPIIIKLRSGAGSANVIRFDTLKESLKFALEIFDRGVYPYSFHEYRSKYATPFKNRVFEALKYALLHKMPRAIFPAHIGYLYAQEFLDNNHHDVRITVIGNRAFGYIRYNRPNDFRASGSGNFDTNPGNIPLEAIILAKKISKEFGFQSMCYDFLYNSKNQIVLNEISYAYVDWMVQSCPGHWGDDNRWVEGRMWPQEAHVLDFVNQLRS